MTSTHGTHASNGHAYAKTALVLQGGGALGAYQAGVYQALSEAQVGIDWVAGISIGAINAALIAGNPHDKRLQRLRQFWQRITSHVPWPAPTWGDASRQIFNRMSALNAIVTGQTGFFAPRFPPAFLHPHGAPGAASIYDTSRLRDTLTEFIDFDLLNSGQTRLSVGAVNIRLGNFVNFDTEHQRIGPEHIMASGALPPGFPAVIIDGEAYWDGGLVSNTPLTQVLDADTDDDTLVFQVDLFSARGALPGDLFEVESRRKHIGYSSRTRLNTDHFRQSHQLKRAIVELFEALPPERRQDEHLRALRDLGRNHAVTIVHLIYRPRGYELHSSDYEFSRASMSEHWQAGLDDTRSSLRHREWSSAPDRMNGVRVFDFVNA
ncbi:MAG: patatin-like phospholipase family protein [Hyphomicrobiaceae bacterium]|nr:patatin-like phospholipase family protein [Hyphomicrobiaceae bacterium]